MNDNLFMTTSGGIEKDFGANEFLPASVNRIAIIILQRPQQVALRASPYITGDGISATLVGFWLHYL